MKLSHSFALCIVLSVWGCGKPAETPKSSTGVSTAAAVTTESSKADLVGTWRSPCIEVETSIYAIFSYTFNADGTGADELSQGYLDENCKKPADAAEYPSGRDEFTFVVGKVLNNKGVTALTVTYDDGVGYTSFLINGNTITFSELTNIESAVSTDMIADDIYTKSN